MAKIISIMKIVIMWRRIESEMIMRKWYNEIMKYEIIMKENKENIIMKIIMIMAK